MDLGPRGVLRTVGRLGTTGKNLLEVARYGGLVTGEEPAAYDVVERTSTYRLRRYGTSGPALLLVPPLMLTAEVYDVSPQASAVRSLVAAGLDPWVVDFGSPEREEGGTERTLAEHVLAVSRAVDTARAAVGADVHLGGYSQGGMFAYQTAAYRRGEGLASLVTFGSPVHLRGAMPLGLPEDLGVRAATFVVEGLLDGRAVPGWMTRLGFQLLDPVGAVRQQVEFLLQLHDRESLLPREGQRRFLGGEGWVAWPGPALAQFVRDFLVHNRMLQGGFTIGERPVTLADVALPILTFVGETDDIAPPASVRPIVEAAPRAEVYEVPLRAGHFGLVVGRTAMARTWPVVAQWVRWREGLGEQPAVVVPAPGAAAGGTRSKPYLAAVGASVSAVVDLSAAALGASAGAVSGARDLALEAVETAPRLLRLSRTRPATRLSLSLLLAERARRSPDDVLFVFEDRAYTHAQAQERIDNVVRGLLSVGVRGGERVGVLMRTRPTALALVAALNRLGAVAVLLRPGADTAREADLGDVTRIIADPEHLEVASRVRPARAFLLGGPNEPRRPDGVHDLEATDVAAVRLPAWYRPDAGRAGDAAFVLFSGEHDAPQVTRITNGRWALSALGTASAAGMSEADTVYSATPLHHPSGLLTSVGAAIASGARLAMTTRWEQATFWSEVRRYGVTVVPYTWTQLQPLVDAPPDPLERAHGVRLFLGSGMPPGLWRRVTERFAPARVLEFWVSTDSGAILANVSGAKPGAMGRPLPGSPQVRLARYDLTAGVPVEGDDGLVLPARTGQTGLLLARRDAALTDVQGLSGLFRPGDAWIPTGALVRRDVDGDLWLLGTTGSVVRTPRGPLLPRPVTDALEELPAVALAVCYGVADGGTRRSVAAVVLVPGEELDPEQVGRALRRLAAHNRPDVVRVVDELPTTPWHRPLVEPLAAQGVPPSRPGAPVLVLDEGGRDYREA